MKSNNKWNFGIKQLKNILFVFLSAAVLSIVPFCHGQENDFPLRDGDTWVMAGDSITAQHLHSNYFEAFCYARFPNLTFHFRNSGVGGDTIPKTLARFSWDIEAWKPTVVSVELGMNDSGQGPESTPSYISNMNILVDRIRKAGARPVLFTSSAVNDGTSSRNLKGRNLTIDLYSSALEGFAAAHRVPFANQFHTLLDLWGANKIVENMILFSENVKATVSISDVPGKDLLEQWIDTWEKSGMEKRGINLGGNPVHPGPAGQIMMSTMLLKGLKAPGLVSTATIDASGKVIEEVQCRVTGVKRDGKSISFDRIDQSLPMPIPDNCRGALRVLPSMEELSRWILTIKEIKPGNYRITVDGVEVAVVSSVELDKGWNMGLLEKGPVADQCRLILELVSEKEKLVGLWRAKSKSASVGKILSETDKASLEEMAKQVLDADAKIKIAAKPAVHRFVISPADTDN
ncbi:MAG TPA: GDSL-type esterase/lipase family protein [bacterium]|nr:GDSL-type esterase/lipase family protein [bacterium]